MRSSDPSVDCRKTEKRNVFLFFPLPADAQDLLQAQNVAILVPRVWLVRHNRFQLSGLVGAKPKFGRISKKGRSTCEGPGWHRWRVRKVFREQILEKVGLGFLDSAAVFERLSEKGMILLGGPRKKKQRLNSGRFLLTSSRRITRSTYCSISALCVTQTTVLSFAKPMDEAHDFGVWPGPAPATGSSNA